MNCYSIQFFIPFHTEQHNMYCFQVIYGINKLFIQFIDAIVIKIFRQILKIGENSECIYSRPDEFTRCDKKAPLFVGGLKKKEACKHKSALASWLARTQPIATSQHCCRLLQGDQLFKMLRCLFLASRCSFIK